MLWRGMRQQRDPPSPRGCFAGQGASIDPCCASESNSPRRVAKSRERLSEAGMVDLLGMFRRRPAKRNPPGFARTRGDITSLEDAMEMLQQNQVRDAPPLARDGSRGAAPPRQETRQEARQPEKPRPRAKPMAPLRRGRRRGRAIWLCIAWKRVSAPARSYAASAFMSAAARRLACWVRTAPG